MKRLLIFVIPVLFLASSCEQGGKNGGDNKSDGKDTSAQKHSQKAEKNKSDKEKLRFPKPSPKGVVKQMIGVNKAKIVYYRPSVHDPYSGEKRQIWGKLVPYDTMWRTGANANTTIQFTHDVNINGKQLKAGKYSFFTIPGKQEWTLIFNKKTDHGGTAGYSKKRDALRVKVKPESTNYHEMMTFHFQDVTDSTARIELAWKETAVPFNVSMNTDKHVMAMINNAVENAGENDWEVYNKSAEYLIGEGKMLDKAEKWVNKSIEIEENWRNLWTKHELMKEKGEMKKAIEIAKKAKKTGEDNDIPKRYIEYMDENIKELEKKAES